MHARHRAEREFGAIMGMLERCGSAVDRALGAATGLSYGAGEGARRIAQQRRKTFLR